MGLVTFGGADENTRRTLQITQTMEFVIWQNPSNANALISMVKHISSDTTAKGFCLYVSLSFKVFVCLSISLSVCFSYNILFEANILTYFTQIIGTFGL